MGQKSIRFQCDDFRKIPYYGEKNISVFDQYPFRILENPNVSIFQMMNIFWMVWKFICQNRFKRRLRGIDEGVCDEEFHI